MIILTDLSEVLIRGVPGAEEFIEERYDKEAAKKLVSRHHEINSTFQDLLRGSITEDAYWQEFFKEGNYPFDAAEAREALSWNLTQAIPGTLNVYQRIIAYPRSFGSGDFGMAKGMPTIYIVSDHIANRINEIKAEHPGIFRVVKDEFWSCDLGKIKGDPEFFPMVLKDGHMKPDEVLFIDDDQGNIDSAARAGIRGIRFENAIQLETVLKGYGFVFASKIS